MIEHLLDLEISIGDYVLTNGAIAAVVLVDAIVRLLPGTLGHDRSAADDSFSNGLLEAPQWTRPATFRGWSVPEVLRSGDHARVARWRRAQALHRTLATRPDLVERRGGLTAEERALLESIPGATYDRSSPDVAQEHRAP